jgi:hypothetical protein
MARGPWPVPDLPSVGALARFLDLDAGQLSWLADVRGLERTVDSGALRHYRYTWLARDPGPPRAIERPKARLKAASARSSTSSSTGSQPTPRPTDSSAAAPRARTQANTWAAPW